MSSASFTTPEQFDIIAGMDVLERWRLKDDETRSFEVTRSHDDPQDDNPVWNIYLHIGNGPRGKPVNSESLLQAARQITGANDSQIRED